MSKLLIVANWKMNPPSAEAAARLLALAARELRGIGRGAEVVICPPFPYLALASRTVSARRRFTLGAQNAFWEAEGAYTGEVSPLMLRDLGVRYVIIGHSERRRLLGESDATVNQKVKAVLKARLVPVIAIGEEFHESQEVVPPILSQELSRAMSGIPRRALGGTVVAYEPVWAIGTGQADTPDSATRRAIYIRKLLTKLLGGRTADTIRILYGGSVSAKNAAAFLSTDIRGMEGLLVGGASLNIEEFVNVVKAVAAVGKRRS